MELIDKAAIVALLREKAKESRKNATIAHDNNNLPVAAVWSGKENLCLELLGLLDTLEVKEVDLEEDVDRILEECDWNFDKIDFCEFAKHFFELGIAVSNKAKKEETPNKELADEIIALSKRYPEVSFAKLSRIAVRIAKWQKEQDEKGE